MTESPSTPPSPESQTTDHRVVVFGMPDDPEPFLKLLGDVPGMDRNSTAHAVYSLPGIIPRPMTRDLAVQLASNFRDLGLTAMAVPAEETADYSHARQTHHIRAMKDSLESIEPNNELESWSWSQVQLISVGAVQSDAPARQRPIPTIASGSSHRIWNERVLIPSRNRPEALIVLKGHNLAIYFGSDEMNYEYLEERRSSSSSSNFSLLIGDIVGHAANAWLTPSTRAFLEKGPVRHYQFRSHLEFCHYTEFQSLLSQQVKH